MGFIKPDASGHNREKSRRCGASPAVVVLVCAVCLLALPVAAHSPTGMDVSFDPNTAKIYVTITHPVDDPATHYLKTVRVKLNGRVISDPDYKSQPEKDTFTLTYDVNANPGDAIRVTAICSRGGTLEGAYDVPQPVRPVTSAVPAVPVASMVPAASGTPADLPPATKAPVGLFSLIGAAGAVLVIKRL